MTILAVRPISNAVPKNVLGVKRLVWQESKRGDSRNFRLLKRPFNMPTLPFSGRSSDVIIRIPSPSSCPRRKHSTDHNFVWLKLKKKKSKLAGRCLHPFLVAWHDKSSRENDQFDVGSSQSCSPHCGLSADTTHHPANEESRFQRARAGKGRRKSNFKLQWPPSISLLHTLSFNCIHPARCGTITRCSIQGI